jgi:hypothetical protein
LFFDGLSETLFNEISTPPLVRSRVLLNIEQFEIGSRYVTAKIQNRYADEVTINIQGGRPGIELQESLFKIKDHEKGDRLYYAYLLTKLIQTGKILSIKDAYDELENNISSRPNPYCLVDNIFVLLLGRQLQIRRARLSSMYIPVQFLSRRLVLRC